MLDVKEELCLAIGKYYAAYSSILILVITVKMAMQVRSQF